MKTRATPENTEMTHLTSLAELKRHITLLTSVEETGASVISAYLNLENGQAGWRRTLDERARILRRILKGDDLADFEEALGKIEDWLATELLPDAKGAAILESPHTKILLPFSSLPVRSRLPRCPGVRQGLRVRLTTKVCTEFSPPSDYTGPLCTPFLGGVCYYATVLARGSRRPYPCARWG